MLIGNWKNIEDLEDCLSLDELKLILQSNRERELRNQKFMAALKGIDLDANLKKEAETDFLAVKQRVDAKLAGISQEQYELGELGFDYESDEE